MSKKNEEIKNEEIKNEEIKNEEIKNEEITTEEIQDENVETKEKDPLTLKEEELNALNDKYLRLLAEYDNFKKRTIKEKEAIYVDAAGAAITKMLDVIDNLERALTTIDDKDGAVFKGVEMILKQTQDIFKNLGVEEIKAVGEEFNPELHNAVMHIEDETLGENVIAQEFQKGYIYKEKVLRYSMVKVAN